MALTNSATQLSLRAPRLRTTPITNWDELIEHELATVPQRILAETGGVLKLKLAERVPIFIWREAGTNYPYKRAIQQTIERHLVTPLLRLVRTGQLSAGKTIVVEVDEHGKKLLFDCNSARRAPRAVLF